MSVRRTFDPCTRIREGCRLCLQSPDQSTLALQSLRLAAHRFPCIVQQPFVPVVVVLGAFE